MLYCPRVAEGQGWKFFGHGGSKPGGSTSDNTSWRLKFGIQARHAE